MTRKKSSFCSFSPPLYCCFQSSPFVPSFYFPFSFPLFSRLVSKKCPRSTLPPRMLRHWKRMQCVKHVWNVCIHFLSNYFIQAIKHTIALLTSNTKHWFLYLTTLIVPYYYHNKNLHKPLWFAGKVMTSYVNNWFTLLLLCTSTPLVLCCDRFDRGSRQVNCELVTGDYDVSLCQGINSHLHLHVLPL